MGFQVNLCMVGLIYVCCKGALRKFLFTFLSAFSLCSVKLHHFHTDASGIPTGAKGYPQGGP